MWYYDLQLQRLKLSCPPTLTSSRYSPKVGVESCRQHTNRFNCCVISVFRTLSTLLPVRIARNPNGINRLHTLSISDGGSMKRTNVRSIHPRSLFSRRGGACLYACTTRPLSSCTLQPLRASSALPSTCQRSTCQRANSSPLLTPMDSHPSDAQRAKSHGMTFFHKTPRGWGSPGRLWLTRTPEEEKKLPNLFGTCVDGAAVCRS